MAARKVEQLKKMPIFAQCTKSEIANLALNADEVDVEAGRTLIVQGEPNHTFYLLLKGEVEVDVRGLPPVRLGPGDFFGEISMVAPGAATATVVTMSPVEALVMSRAQFHSKLQTLIGVDRLAYCGSGAQSRVQCGLHWARRTRPTTQGKSGAPVIRYSSKLTAPCDGGVPHICVAERA